MKIKPLLALLPVGVGALMLQPRMASADTVLYDSASFVMGQQASQQTFTLSAPGVLTVNLSSVPWLDSIQDLTFFLTSASGSVGQTMGAGTETYDLAAGTYFAHWFGEATGPNQVGVEKLELQFHPDATTPVPLPTSLMLLLAGLGLLLGWQRRTERPLAAGHFA